ncbi:MAG TPA: rhodanese-like domain-containing protein [Ruania sp.]|nr:rhodanese-like domain-containing protein [Ruania sp.]
MTYAGDLTPSQAWEVLQDNPHAVLVDVRTRAEWSFVGVPDTSGIGRTTAFVEWNTYPEGTRNENFLAQLAEAGVTAEAPVLFLCRSGARSLAAAEAATAAGFGPAYNVLDGFEGATNTDGHRGDTGWRAEGLPWKQS